MQRYSRIQSQNLFAVAFLFTFLLVTPAAYSLDPGTGRIPSINDLPPNDDTKISVVQCSRALDRAYEEGKRSPLRAIRNSIQYIQLGAYEDDRIMIALLSQIFWSSKASTLGTTRGGIFPTFFPGIEHLFPIPTKDKEIKRTILLTLVDVLQNAIRKYEDVSIGHWKEKESPDSKLTINRGMILILFPEDPQINQRLSNSLAELRGKNVDPVLADLPRTLVFSPVRPLCELEGYSCGPRSLLGGSHQFLFFGIVDPRGRMESDIGATAMNVLPESRMPEWVDKIVSSAKFHSKHQLGLADRLDLPTGQTEVFELHLSGAFNADMLAPFFFRLIERLHQNHDEVRIHLNVELVRELDLDDQNIGTFAFQINHGEKAENILSRFGKQLFEDKSENLFELQTASRQAQSPRQIAQRMYQSRVNNLKTITLVLQAENPAAE